MTSLRFCLLPLALAAIACPGLETDAPDAGSDAAGAAVSATDSAPPDTTAADTTAADTSTTDLAAVAERVDYTLDLTAVREPFAGAPGGERVGVPLFSHNSHALFSIDLTTTSKTVERLSWETVVKLQGKETCHDFPDDRAYVLDSERGAQALRPYDPDNALKGFRSPHRVRLRGIDLQMPYRVAHDEQVRMATAVCVAVRTGDGVWRWRARRFLATQHPGRGVATAHRDLEVNDVDAVAILFEATTPVSSIRYTIERLSDPPPVLTRGDLATAACCSACATDGPDLASRYCCSSRGPSPEPCIEEQSALTAECRPARGLYDQAVAACRARSLWLRDYQLLDPNVVCTSPDRLITGYRGVSYKCCRDPHFIPTPPDAAGPAPDCISTGGLSTPCQSNAAMLARQVELCFSSGRIHRLTTFGNECPGVGSSSVSSVCCLPGVPGPPVSACTM
jgi:hypothetical protein